MSSPGFEQTTAFEERLRTQLPFCLPNYLKDQRWFGGKARQIRSTELTDVIPMVRTDLEAFILLVRVEFSGGPGESYVLPMLRSRKIAEEPDNKGPHLRLHDDSGNIVLSDALSNERFLSALLESIENKTGFRGRQGEVQVTQMPAFASFGSEARQALAPKPLKSEQSNSSAVYGDSLILKFYRRLEAGINLDFEMGCFLSEKAHFKNTPPLLASLEYQDLRGNRAILGMLQAFVPNRGDAWKVTRAALRQFWEEVSNYSSDSLGQSPVESGPIPAYERKLPPLAYRLLAPYLDTTETLAQRTAEMHLALASEHDDPTFAPEPFTKDFQRWLEESTRDSVKRNFDLLRQKEAELPGDVRQLAKEVLRREHELLERLGGDFRTAFSAMRTRIHGDYHLGQLLYTGSDFVIIDFEGEPARPLWERRLKRSPLQDIAGMMRSFHYVSYASLIDSLEAEERPRKDIGSLIPWANRWYIWVTMKFLKKYFEVSGSAIYIPQRRDELLSLLQVSLLEKAVYELGYELNNRPGWVRIPLEGISNFLKGST